ncbi:MAG: two-component regulator propeller domain-containing protein, partial [Chitinophagales bacterium]
MYKNQKTVHTKVFFLFNAMLWFVSLFGQTPDFNFHHLTTAQGLSDPTVRCATRDQYGFMWFGTYNGLDRYNGYDVKVFQHDPKDSFSLPDNNIAGLFCDGGGNLWVSSSSGIYKYDYSDAHFIFQPGSDAFKAGKMVQGLDDIIYIATSKGLVLFNVKAGIFTFLFSQAVSDPQDLLKLPVNDFCIGSNTEIWLATNKGLIVYRKTSRVTERIEIKELGNRGISNIAIDQTQSLWISYDDNGARLLKVDSGLIKKTIYPQFSGYKTDFADNKINTVFTDSKGRIWVTTIRLGLFLYDPSADDFSQSEYDPLQSMSLASDFLTFLYQDREGFIWIGTGGYGVEYFHPDRNLFHTIQPSFNQNPTLPDNWCRAASEDNQGNLWLGTSGGLAKYDVRKQQYTIFQNTTTTPSILYSNSIRSILCDEDKVWIGENGGLNCYHIS